ncbi:hypothetical protein N7510_000175 [Penicillium lagena]|uniref:uncharacterized protein n=1 Tax=Penicillium lagena TaxID=94218 RepID=UPI002540F1CD|nr:uncharacterized protein N7510_000175 [Penicillium lagena]KAJ5623866.1 hypothetical protein N7510_000175 [Penicillium lagena]
MLQGHHEASNVTVLALVVSLSESIAAAAEAVRNQPVDLGMSVAARVSLKQRIWGTENICAMASSVAILVGMFSDSIIDRSYADELTALASRSTGNTKIFWVIGRS